MMTFGFAFAAIALVVVAAGALPSLKEMSISKSEKLYSLTGTTGSLMYMAPEVSHSNAPHHFHGSVCSSISQHA